MHAELFVIHEKSYSY